MSWRGIWLCALAVKLVLAAVIPLSNDEAYYWVWSHHFQLSYFDHPPFISWIFFVGRIFEPLRHLFSGHDLSGVLRFGGILLAHSSLLILRKTIGTSISENQHKYLLLIILLSPFFGIGSIIMTPDIPLIFFWTLSLLFFKRHLERPTALTAAALGAALGLGFVSKYVVVLFVPIAIAYVLWNRRFDVCRPVHLISAIIAGLIFSSPVLYWNATHDWVSFRFQLSHGLDQEAHTLSQIFMQFGDYTGAQLALLSPLVLFTFWKREEPTELRFLRWFGWGPVLFFAWTSLKSPVEANWPIAGHLSLLALAAIANSTANSVVGSRKILGRSMMAIWGVASAIVIVQAFRPAEPLFGVEADRLKTHEFVRFKELAPIASANRDFFASSYQMAGALSLDTGRTIAKLQGINRPDFFDFHESGRPTAIRFTVAIDAEWPWPAWIAENGYKESSRSTIGKFTLVTFAKNEVAP